MNITIGTKITVEREGMLGDEATVTNVKPAEGLVSATFGDQSKVEDVPHVRKATAKPYWWIESQNEEFSCDDQGDPASIRMK